MRSILALSSAAIVTVLLATTAGGRIAAAGPDDCSISGMSGSLACPLSSWTAPTPAPAPQASVVTPQAPAGNAPPMHVGSTTAAGCTSHYELYSSHVKWVNDCPTLSELPTSSPSAQ